jgi:hypothetical protein
MVIPLPAYYPDHQLLPPTQPLSENGLLDSVAGRLRPGKPHSGSRLAAPQREQWASRQRCGAVSPDEEGRPADSPGW